MDASNVEGSQTTKTRLAFAGLKAGEYGSFDYGRNYGAIYDEIIRMKPASAKGRYVKSINVASTMSPSIPVDPSVQRNYTQEA